MYVKFEVVSSVARVDVCTILHHRKTYSGSIMYSISINYSTISPIEHDFCRLLIGHCNVEQGHKSAKTGAN